MKYDLNQQKQSVSYALHTYGYDSPQYVAEVSKLNGMSNNNNDTSNKSYVGGPTETVSETINSLGILVFKSIICIPIAIFIFILCIYLAEKLLGIEFFF